MIRDPERLSNADLIHDKTLVFSWEETLDQSVARNRELFVRGFLSLSDFEYRLEMIFTRHPERDIR